jgi:hypothetical protein
MTKLITYNLLENALDHLLLAGEHAKIGSSRMLKHAIATLFEGVELLLKARLEMDDWKLLFQDAAKADRARYESGDFQSVTFDKAVERLKELCCVTIDNTHLPTLKTLRLLRNKIRHGKVTTDQPTATSLITKTYSFALGFLNESLAFSGQDDGDLLAADLRSLLGEFDEFVTQRLSEIDPEMDRLGGTFVTCPFCLQTTFSGNNGIATCLFCGYEGFSEMAVDEWMSRGWTFSSREALDAWMKHSSGVCPDCDEAACVIIEGTEGLLYVCISCGQDGKFAECSVCGELVNSDGRCAGCSTKSPPGEG